MTSSSPAAARRATRAPALPPEQRRQAIVEAVLPLLVEHGGGVTTRELAEAAGVAEGTLFRVFEDKAALLHAAAHSVLDPDRAWRALADVDPDLALDAMVATVAEQLLESRSRVMAVLMAVRGALATEPSSRGRSRPDVVRQSDGVLLEGLTALFARYPDELRVEPERAARALRALVFGSRQPWATEKDALTGPEIADLLVAGVREVPPC
ncbi:MAG TPA: TetR/AcrR family transcriptional regulator [Mycobacteriales bacterium]|jgi:AcrR family transcriptional regulator|nr:TetR/AcrR family transcriptional regulator [Mycobacteriales bacterium]